MRRRTGKPDKQPVAPRQRLYQAAIVVAALAIGWAMFASTVANVTAARAPGIALRFWPNHAVAQARYADALLSADPRRPDVEGAGAHAAASIRRSPTLAGAVRVAAIRALMQRRQRLGERLFELSDALSRRDVPTQLWLLEREVTRNDVPRALERYGIILAVSPEMKDALFPVLSAAIADPALTLPIARLVGRGKAWRAAFLYHVGEHQPNPAVASEFLLLLARMGMVPEVDQIQRPLGRLLNDQNHAAAARLYRLVDPAWNAADPSSQLDGGFDRPRDLTPLGWEINNEIAWKAARGENGGNPALHANAGGDAAAWVARRMLVIPAGLYRLQGRYGVSEGDARGAIRIALACSPQGAPIAEGIAPLRAGGGRFSFPLRAQGCAAPWLIVSLQGGEASLPATIWLDDLSLARTG